MKTITLDSTIPESLHNARLDVALSQLFPDYSRSQMQQWIKQGDVQINGKVVQKSRVAVSEGQSIFIKTTLAQQPTWEAQPIALTIVYEDDYLIVINKPIGLVVHPGAGNPSSTLLNALLHHAPELNALPRAGIIHRLDKDTSGLLVIARTLPIYHKLIKQMQRREIHREYRALVQGQLISGGTVDAPMGRHPLHRTKMAVTNDGRDAITHYRVLSRFRTHTLLSVQLETGRTHQIRVHMAHIGYPIEGDTTYGRKRQYSDLSPELKKALQAFDHQALHAYKLGLTNPITQEVHEWTAPLPADFENLLTLLSEGQ